ncbi:permease [uncultured Desulfosarcina sp.]|uniref:permease n=1 Tax=uncultured Desulfosarcina sp. TaxID=218289 RepID=UPI0029C70544|nr:permease [uncultured Desulfosarcina sp.]
MNSRVLADPNHPHPTRQDTPAAQVYLLAQLAFLAALLCLVFFFRRTPWFDTLSITFVSIFLEALPFMLLGALIGGFIEVFVSKTLITRIIPAGILPAILLAAGLGLVFPVCECAIVPVVRRLFSKGLPLGAGIAFLLGGPIVNPLVALSTAVAYGNDLAMAVWAGWHPDI